ncbi:uncharacterized protein EI90DRAFT_3118862 [Cantharellus anzutake]|uniref:uncharacterized protein n=1 Tax=Cantharellus anzutake TaxID=1750568 RepID=UPI0019037006|nr:uncharacterized protein EI90DRAFT_3118862 [Cantharellus anzutake]KAF8337411.1 hypothetical protein EI90DRAFT_3118862 [Cantharellus anzutake]
MADSVPPPPDYTHDSGDLSDDSDTSLQVLITPATGAASFQVGHLGVQDDHASVEGELHVKEDLVFHGTECGTINLITVETVDGHEIELAASESVLFSNVTQSSSSQTTRSLSTPLPFSIPLNPDLPQSVVTPTSSISHALVAKLYPREGTPTVKSHQVQLERYSSPSAVPISVDPVSVDVDSPTAFNVQLPRSIFRVEESIPVYVTIAPPNHSVLRSGLRLRNIMIELWRHVKLGDSSTLPLTPDVGEPIPYPSTSSSEKPPPSCDGATHSNVITRSGSSCRFHSTRSLKMRFIMHDSTAESLGAGNITQTTLLHHVTFEIQVKVSFTSSLSQNASEVSTRIPIIILPPLAPEPRGDISDEIDAAYHKKHDPPPVKTARMDDLGEGSSRPPAFDDVASSSASHPLYPPSPTRYGTSPPSFLEASQQDVLAVPSGSVPPAFTEGEHRLGGSNGGSPSPISPPSFEEVTLTSEATHLPTFIESQVEAHAGPSNTQSSFGHWVFNPALGREEMHFDGEGSLYGFHPSEHYDGLSHSMMQSSARADAHMTTVAMLEDGDPLRTNIPALTEALAQYAGVAVDEDELYMSYGPSADENGIVPPPPPALDDPSDPPPTIDEGVSSLTEAERNRREQAIAEAAASAAAAAATRLNPAGHPLGFILRVLRRRELRNPASNDDIRVEDGRALDAAEESRPPPYLGVPSQRASVHGPPPYVG